MRPTSLIPIFIAVIALFVMQNDSLKTSVSGSSPITSSGAIVGIDIDTDGGLDDLTAGIGLSNCFSDGDVKVFDTSEGDWDCGIRVSGAGGSFVTQLDDVTTVATTTVMDFDDSQFVITENPAEEANISIEDIYLLLAGDSSSGDYTLTGDVDVGGGALQIPNATSLPGTCEIGDQFMDTNATSGQRLYLCESANTWAVQGDGAGGGSAVILDLADDDANESTDLSEIAITGDTNSIFTEPLADKLLIAVGNDWPKADTADDLTCTDCIGATEISDVYALNSGDTITGAVILDDGVGDSPDLTFTPATNNSWDIFVDESVGTLQVETNSGSGERIEFANTGLGSLTVDIDGSIDVAGPLSVISSSSLEISSAFVLLDNQGELRLGEPDGAGSEYIIIEAPATLAANRTCTLEDDATPFDPCVTGGGGSAIVLDLADDDADESSDLSEIAITGDTNSIFTESAADKLLIAVGNDWPKADTADDLTCTDCIGETEISDVYVLVAGDVMTGDLDMSDGVTDSPRVLFRVQTGALWNLYAEDTGDDLQLEVDTVSTETIDIVNIGAGDVDLTLDGTLHLLALDCTGNANGGALTTDGSGVVSCSDDDGGGASGDAIQVEDGDDGGTFTSIDTTARFEDQGHINFAFTDGAGGGPDTITATVRTDALGATEIQDIYVLVAGDVMTGDLDMSDGTTDSPRVLFRVQAGALWNLYAEDTDNDLQIEVNTADPETVDFVNAGAGVVNVTVDGTITGSTAVAGPNVTSGANPGHTHTSTSISGIDVSDDVNLTCGTNCTLSGDEISVDDAFVLNAGDTMTGDLLLDNGSELRLGEPDGAGTEFITIVAPSTLAANRTCTLEDDSTPFDPCVSGAGGGDVTDVGPGCSTGACFTDGLATTGSSILVWEGSGVDTNELTIAGPANPAVDQTFTFPDDNIADDDLLVGNAAGTFEYKALTDCNADANSKLQYDTTANVFSCETTDVILETELDTKAELETQIGDVADFAEADGDVFTGVHDFGGATSLEIPNGTSTVVNLDGEIAHDTTADQLILGATADVIPTTFQKSFTIETPADADNFLLGKWAAHGVTITDIHCLVDPADSAESVVIDIQERGSTGDSPVSVDATITCDNDGAEDDGALSNGTIDKGDWWSIDIGTVTGTVTQVSVTIIYKVTRE